MVALACVAPSFAPPLPSPSSPFLPAPSPQCEGAASACAMQGVSEGKARDYFEAGVGSSPTSTMRSQALEQCLAADVRITSLSTGAVMVRGLDKVLQAWGEDRARSALASDPPAEPGASLFVENGSPGPEAATLSLHLYPAGRSPGLCAKGLQASGAEEPLAVLYRVQSDKINQIWVSNQVPGKAGKEALVASALWPSVLEVVKANTSGSPTFHYNDYLNCEDSLGMGLGSSSVAESWQA